VGPVGGLAGEAQPEWLRGVLGRVNAAQRQLNQTLSRELRRLRGGEVTSAALGVAWIAFLYGVLHAIGPGHGKLVVSSLFLARDARLRTAVGISWLVSLLQTVSAIGIVSVVALALGRGGFAVLRDSRRIELSATG
jgi:ABC-type nickel/cobalt efflux system permease component RcnA